MTKKLNAQKVTKCKEYKTKMAEKSPTILVIAKPKANDTLFI